MVLILAESSLHRAIKTAPQKRRTKSLPTKSLLFLPGLSLNPNALEVQKQHSSSCVISFVKSA